MTNWDFYKPLTLCEWTLFVVMSDGTNIKSEKIVFDSKELCEIAKQKIDSKLPHRTLNFAVIIQTKGPIND